MEPDWTTFNGYANQYVTHPLTADPGDTVRFWVVAAGPTLDSNFHIVGTIFNRAWPNAGRDRHSAARGADGARPVRRRGGVFDVKIDEPGLYPFVSHAFAHVDLGQVGLLRSANRRGRCRTETDGLTARLPVRPSALGGRSSARCGRGSPSGSRRWP